MKNRIKNMLVCLGLGILFCPVVFLVSDTSEIVSLRYVSVSAGLLAGCLACGIFDKFQLIKVALLSILGWWICEAGLPQISYGNPLFVNGLPVQEKSSFIDWAGVACASLSMFLGLVGVAFIPTGRSLMRKEKAWSSAVTG